MLINVDVSLYVYSQLFGPAVCLLVLKKPNYFIICLLSLF